MAARRTAAPADVATRYTSGDARGQPRLFARPFDCKDGVHRKERGGGEVGSRRDAAPAGGNTTAARSCAPAASSCLLWKVK